MNILTTLGLFCLMATAAHAGEPWPENVCHTLAGYERFDVKHYGGDPVKLALARNNLLHMLRNHCGVDETAKEAGDVAATRQDGGGGGGWEPGQVIEFSKPPTTHCTTMSLGGGLSSTDCE
jgi:hypothetical protein